ncbi:Vacuolar protein sorting-associated protein vps5 [Savitreella phatthalungensis]
MSGYVSPYEQDNPFADMRGTSHPVDTQSSSDVVRQEAVTSFGLQQQTQTDSSIDHAAEDPVAAIVSDKGSLDTMTESRDEVAAVSKTAHITSSSKPISSPVKAAGKRTSARRSNRAAALSARLENVDLDVDPLGPLGHSSTDFSEQVSPQLPQAVFSSTAATASTRPSRATSDDEGLAGTVGTASSHAAGNVQAEHTTNPVFRITVGDPTKIGDITSAHTVYRVNTQTTSNAFKNSEMSVTRRFRDFLWLYDQLNRNCPGAIVPPPPEKQAVGRFENDFVEQRRFSLERMLDRIGKHAVLCNDADFKLFLESESFSNDVKHRPVDQRHAHEQNKGFLGLGSAFSFSGKFVEPDDFFEKKRTLFDTLETQLIAMARTMHTVMRQRNELASATSEFGAALSSLSTVELSRSLSNALGNLSDLQIKIKELHERQAQQDFLTLGHTIEEYVRAIGSVKAAMQARQKLWAYWQQAESDCSKRKSTSDKLKLKGKTQQDRMAQAAEGLTEAERRVLAAKTDFEQSSKRLRQELVRFDTEKVEDFKASVEMYLESAVEAQKEVIEHWEFFSDLLTRELDDDHAEAATGSDRPPPEVDSVDPVDTRSHDPGPGSSAELQVPSQDPVVGHPEESESTTPSSSAALGSTLSPPVFDRPLTASAVPIPADEANPFASDR